MITGQCSKQSHGCLRNLHQHVPEPSGTCFRNLHQHVPELSKICRNPPEPSGTFRNAPEPVSGTYTSTRRNIPELPEPLSGTCSSDPHRRTPELIWAEDPISLRCWGKITILKEALHPSQNRCQCCSASYGVSLDASSPDVFSRQVAAQLELKLVPFHSADLQICIERSDF